MVRRHGGQKKRTETRAPLFCIIDNAFSIAKKTAEAKAKAEKQDEDADEDAPMNPGTDNSHDKAWASACGNPLHPSQECMSHKLNSTYNTLKARNVGAEPVKGLYTRRDKPERDAKAKKRKLFSELRFEFDDKSKTVDEDEPYFHANRSPFVYLAALDDMLQNLL